MNNLVVAYFIFGIVFYTLLFCIVPLILKYKHGPYSVKESIEVSFIICSIITIILFSISLLTTDLTVEKTKTLKEAIETNTFENYFQSQEKPTTVKQVSLENVEFSIIPSIIYFLADICILNVGYKKQ